MQIKGPILYFFLLALKILLNRNQKIGHKQDRFFNILQKKDFKFISSDKNGTIIFSLSFLLLLKKLDPIPEEKSCK